MYLGHEDVRHLKQYIRGYRQARADLDIPEFGDGEETILAEFQEWIKARLDVADSNWHGWCECIEILDSSPKNIHTFFNELEAFLQSRGQTLDSNSNTSPPHP